MHTSQVEVRVSVEPRIAVETAETERLISVMFSQNLVSCPEVKDEQQ